MGGPATKQAIPNIPLFQGSRDGKHHSSGVSSKPDPLGQDPLLAGGRLRPAQDVRAVSISFPAIKISAAWLQHNGLDFYTNFLLKWGYEITF